MRIIDMNLNHAYTEILTTGDTSLFNIGFDFYESTDRLNVFIDGTDISTTHTVVLTTPTTLQITPVVPTGKRVRIERETDIDQTKFKFTAGAEFDASHVDANFEQIRHSQQEIKDTFQKLADTTYPLVEGLADALESANQSSIAAQAAAAQADAAAESANEAITTVNNSLSTTESERLPYWYAKVGGFSVNQHLRLTNGILVRSTIDANTTNPNVDMTGWTYLDTASNGLTVSARNSTVPTIVDYFTESELNTFKSNPNMDCTAIIRRAFATGAKRINFLDLQLHITLSSTMDDPLAVFNTGDIELLGNGAAFIDDTVYASTVASFNPLFVLTGGVTSFKSNVSHIGLTLSNMASYIGYRGATYVYSKGANSNISLDVNLTNTRYGILAGDYANPALGGTKGIRANLRCSNVGYPIATYLADDIVAHITGSGFHRAAYIAGANYARITALVKDFYIAQVAVLFTDAKTGLLTSKGCSDVQVHIVDQGSTVYVNNSYLCGVSLSRVDVGTTFDNITLDATLVSSDTIAAKLGHSIINSTVKNILPVDYPLNWVAGINLNRITITGLIDRSAQTVAEHDVGDVYMLTEDGASNFATVRQLRVNNLEYRGGIGSKPRTVYIINRGLVGKAHFNNVNVSPDAAFLYGSNGTSMTYFDRCTLRGLSTGVSDQLPNTACTFTSCSIYGALLYISPINKVFLNSPVSPIATPVINSKSTDLLLTGLSTTWSAALPINSIILGVRGVLLASITGATGYTVGDSTTAAKFVNTNNVLLGTGFTISNAPAATYPYVTTGTGNVVVTAKTSAFLSGTLRLIVDYIQLDIPSTS